MAGWSLQGFPPSLSPECDRQKPAPRELPKLNLRGLHRWDFQCRAIWLAAATVTFTLWCSTLSSLSLDIIQIKLLTFASFFFVFEFFSLFFVLYLM